MSYARVSSRGGVIATPLNGTVPEPTMAASSPKVLEVLGHTNDHVQHCERLFIGPMLFSAAERTLDSKDSGSNGHWWLGRRDVTSSDDDIDDEVPERHAFLYFLRRGGVEGEWTSQASLRKRVKREILHHWQQSGWSFLQTDKKDIARRRKWVGTSFKIGDDFLGIPIHTNVEAVRPMSSDPLSQPVASTSQGSASFSRTLSTQTYYTAPEGPSNTRTSSPSCSSEPNNGAPISNGSDAALILIPPGPPSPRKAALLPGLLASTSLAARAHTDTQITRTDVSPVGGSKAVPAASENDISSSYTPIPLRSALQQVRQEGGTKAVHFSAVPQSQIEPVSPSEVLARPPSSAPDTSAGASVTQTPDRVQGDALKYGDVIRQERMLVRRSSVKSSNVSMHFDAEEAMKLRDFRSYEWKEFLVIWRKEQLELYEDYSIPGKETLLGHKHLAYMIPLQRPNTRISLYSFVDLTFCLACKMVHVPKNKIRKATGLSVRMLFHKTMGTDVFVFKTKTRTSGIDWMWELWRQLGNDLPQSFEVHCPALQTRVKLNIPEYDGFSGEGYKVFTKDYVVSLCQSALGGLPSWDYLIEEPLRRGACLELCWRKGSMLDWIRWEMDVDGMKRGWTVLYGLCLGRPRDITHLEVRVGEHRPNTVALANGTHLREPPAIEGYLSRIKPNSQSRPQVYLSTHGGCLFSTHPSRAYPPPPPIPMTDDVIQSGIDVDESSRRSFFGREIQRGALQVLQADTFIDLRSITVVRRAFQNVFRPISPFREGECSLAPSPDLGRNADEEDEGGEEVLTRHSDKPTLRMRRSFELLMKTGHVVRFEAYSCKVAQEWVERLSQLIEYWAHRHRVDAIHEMELIHAIAGNSGPTIMRRSEHTVPERLPDYDAASEYLPSFWNWCVVDGCLSVMRNGRLFLRRSLRGQYRLMQLMLVSGHLVQFHITSHQSSQHVRSQSISLLDAYVCSGHFVTQSLPIDEFATTQEPLRRRFQDGLESEDHEADTIFLVSYRPHPVGDMAGNASKLATPPLNAKRRVLVLKARSKLERDAWCWALHSEIERLSRSTRERETAAQAI